MKEVIINVPDMQSAHCQTRVNNVVSAMEVVQIDKLEAEKITVSLASENLEGEVINAIEKAGYSTSTEGKSGSSCSTGCCS